MIDRILVPLDGSALAESTLPHASALARAFDAEVRLMRVLDPGRAGGLTHDSLDSRLQRREIESYLECRAERLRSDGIRVRTAVGEGTATEEIVRRVRDDDIDLMLASAWGQSGPSELYLGGTARKLISGAHTSIMLIRPCVPAGRDDVPVRYGRIVVPVDGSRRADWALCLATSIARSQRAKLLMVHVVSVPEPPARMPRQPLEERLRRELVKVSRSAAEQYLDDIKRGIDAPDLDLRWKVVVGSRVPDALLATARLERADLVVMSAHGACDDTPWPYGSVAAGMLNYCDLPLLVFQDRPRTARRPRPEFDRAGATVPAGHAAG